MQRMDSNVDLQFQQNAAQLTLLALSQPRAAKLRVQAWLAKLREPTSNVVWKRNRNMYCALLLAQLQQGQLDLPFTAMPPDGSLPNLPNHLLYRALSPSHGLAQPGSGSPVGGAAQQLHANLAPCQLQGLVQTFHSNMQARGFDLTRSRAGSAGRRGMADSPGTKEPTAKEGMARKTLLGPSSMQPGCECASSKMTRPGDATGVNPAGVTHSIGRTSNHDAERGGTAKPAISRGDRTTRTQCDQHRALQDDREGWAPPAAGEDDASVDQDAAAAASLAAEEAEIAARVAAKRRQQHEAEQQRQDREKEEARYRQQHQHQREEESEWQRQAREEEEMWRRQRQHREQQWEETAERQRQARQEEEARRWQEKQRRAAAKAHLDDVISRYSGARRQWASPQNAGPSYTRPGGPAGGAAWRSPAAVAPPEVQRQGQASTTVGTVTLLTPTGSKACNQDHGAARSSSPRVDNLPVHTWVAATLRRAATLERLSRDQSRMLQLDIQRDGARPSRSLDDRGGGGVWTKLRGGQPADSGGSGTAADISPGPSSQKTQFEVPNRDQVISSMFASPRNPVLPHYHSTVSYSPHSGSPPMSTRRRSRSQISSPTASPSGRKVWGSPDPVITYNVTRQMRSSPRALEALVKKVLDPTPNVTVVPSDASASLLVPQPLVSDRSSTIRRRAAPAKFEFSSLITSLLPPPPVALATASVPLPRHVMDRDSPGVRQAAPGSPPNGVCHAGSGGGEVYHATSGGDVTLVSMAPYVHSSRSHCGFESPGSSLRSDSSRAAALPARERQLALQTAAGMACESSNMVNRARSGHSSQEPLALRLVSPPASPRRLAAMATAAIAARPSPQRSSLPRSPRAPPPDRRTRAQPMRQRPGSRFTEPIRPGRGGSEIKSAAGSRPASVPRIISAPSSRMAPVASSRPASVPTSSRFVPKRRSAAPARPRLSGSTTEATVAAPLEGQSPDAGAAPGATERAQSSQTFCTSSTQLVSHHPSSPPMATTPNSIQLTEMARRNLAASLPPSFSFTSSYGSSRATSERLGRNTSDAGDRTDIGGAGTNGAGSGAGISSLGLLDLNESSGLPYGSYSEPGLTSRDGRSTQTSKNIGSGDGSTAADSSAAAEQQSWRGNRYGFSRDPSKFARSSRDLTTLGGGSGHGTEASGQAWSNDNGFTGPGESFGSGIEAHALAGGEASARIGGAITGGSEPSQLAGIIDSFRGLVGDEESDGKGTTGETVAGVSRGPGSGSSFEMAGFSGAFEEKEGRSTQVGGTDGGGRADPLCFGSCTDTVDLQQNFSERVQRLQQTPTLVVSNASAVPRTDLADESSATYALHRDGQHGSALGAAALPSSIHSQLDKLGGTQAQPYNSFISSGGTTASWTGPGGMSLAMRSMFALSAAEAAGELALLDVEGVIQEFERSLQDHLEFELRPALGRAYGFPARRDAGSGGGTRFEPQTVQCSDGGGAPGFGNGGGAVSGSSGGGGGGSSRSGDTGAGSGGPLHSAASRIADRFALHSALGDFRQAFNRLRRRLALHVNNPAVADALYGTSGCGASGFRGAGHRYSSNPARSRRHDRQDRHASSSAQQTTWRPGGGTLSASVDSTLRLTASRRSSSATGLSSAFPGSCRTGGAERFTRVAAEAVAHYRDDVALLLSRVRAVLRASVDSAVRGLSRSNSATYSDEATHEARGAALHQKLKGLAEDKSSVSIQELGLRRRLVSEVLHALEESAHQLGLQLVTLAAAPINMPPPALSRLRAALHDHLDAALAAGRTAAPGGIFRGGDSFRLSMPRSSTGFQLGGEGRSADHRELSPSMGGPFARPSAQAWQDVVEDTYPAGSCDLNSGSGDGGDSSRSYIAPAAYRGREEAGGSGLPAVAEVIATVATGTSTGTGSEDLPSTVGATAASDSLGSEAMRIQTRLSSWHQEEPAEWLGDMPTPEAGPAGLAECLGDNGFLGHHTYTRPKPLHQSCSGVRPDADSKNVREDNWRVGSLQQLGGPEKRLANLLLKPDGNAGGARGGRNREVVSEGVGVGGGGAVAAASTSSIGMLAKVFASPPAEILPSSAVHDAIASGASPIGSASPLRQGYQHFQPMHGESAGTAIPTLLPPLPLRASVSPSPPSGAITPLATVDSTTATINTMDKALLSSTTSQASERAGLGHPHFSTVHLSNLASHRGCQDAVPGPKLRHSALIEETQNSAAAVRRLSRELEAAVSAVREAAEATARQAAVAAAERQAAQEAARQAASEAQIAAIEAAHTTAREAAAKAAREAVLAAVVEWQTGHSGVTARSSASEVPLLTRDTEEIEKMRDRVLETAVAEEAEALRRELQDGNAQTAKLQERVGELCQRLLEAEEEVARSDRVAEDLRKQLLEAQQAAQSLKDQLMNAEEVAQKRNWQVEELCRQLAEAQESEAARSQEADGLRRELAAVEAAELASAQKADHLHSQLAAAKEAAEAMRLQQINGLNNQLDAAKEEVGEARNQLAAQRNAQEAALREADVLRKKLRDAERAAENRSREADELRRQLSLARQAAEKETSLIGDLKRRLSEAQTTAETINAEASSLQLRLADSQRRVNAADREVGALHHQVATAKVTCDSQVREAEALHGEKAELQQAQAQARIQQSDGLHQCLQAVEERGRDLLGLQHRLVEKQAEAAETSLQLQDLYRQLSKAKEARETASAAREAASSAVLEAVPGQSQMIHANRPDAAPSLANILPSLVDLRELAVAAAREAASAVFREAAAAQARDAAVTAAREEAATAAVVVAREAAAAAAQGSAAVAAERETATAALALTAGAASSLAVTRAVMLETSQMAPPFLQADGPGPVPSYTTIQAMSRNHAHRVKYDLTAAAPYDAMFLSEPVLASEAPVPAFSALPPHGGGTEGQSDTPYTLISCAPQPQSPQSYRAVVREVPSPRGTDNAGRPPKSPSPRPTAEYHRSPTRSLAGSPPQRNIVVEAHAPVMLMGDTSAPAVAAAVAAVAAMHHDTPFCSGPVLPSLAATTSPRLPDYDEVCPVKAYDHDGACNLSQGPQVARTGGNVMPPLQASPPPPPPPRDWMRSSVHTVQYSGNDGGCQQPVRYPKANFVDADRVAHRVAAVHDVYSPTNMALQDFRLRRQELAASPPAHFNNRTSSVTTISNLSSDGSGAHHRDSRGYTANTCIDSRLSGSGISSGFRSSSGNGSGSGSGGGGGGGGGAGNGSSNWSGNGRASGSSCTLETQSISRAHIAPLAVEDSRRKLQEFQHMKRQLGLVDTSPPPLTPATTLGGSRTLRTVPTSPQMQHSENQQEQMQPMARARSASYDSGSSLTLTSMISGGEAKNGARNPNSQGHRLDPRELAQRLRRLTDRTTQLQQRVAKLTKPLDGI